MIRPTYLTSAGPLVYRENQASRPLGNVALLSDVDSPDFGGGVLSVSLAANGNAKDRLEIRDRTGTPNRIGINGANVTYNGVVIGTFTGGVGTTPLSVSLNSAATQPIVQALLRSLTFRTLGDNPSTLARTVNIVITDGDGGTSNPAAKTVTVEALTIARSSRSVALRRMPKIKRRASVDDDRSERSR